MFDRIKAYFVIAALILVGVAIGKMKAGKEIVYVVRE